VKARLRQKTYPPNKKQKEKHRKKNQLFVSTTAEGYKSVYELFVKNPAADSKLIHMSTYSNPHLPPDYIDDLRSSYPAQLIEAYLMGGFTSLTDKPVWVSFDINGNTLAKNTPKEWKTPQPNETLLLGMDFNVGRGCVVIYVKRKVPKTPTTPTGEILLVVDEIKDSYDTPDTIRILNERYPKEKFPNRIVFPDASGNNRKSVNATISDISLLQQNNFRIKKHKKNPNIKDRVASANAALYNAKQETKVFLVREKTPYLIEALEQHVYNKQGIPTKGEGKFDDLADAFSYPIAYMFPIKRQTMFNKNLRGL
jgi:hypothetical protein